MSRRASAAPLVCALWLIGSLALTACAKRPSAADRRGPFLSIVRAEDGPGARRAVAPESISLALAGVAPEEVRRLRASLTEATEVALRRAAPDLLDLGGVADAGAPPDPLRQALPELPALTAAANLLGSPWIAPGIAVRLGPACEPAAARCVSLFEPAQSPADPLVRRGRALAWSLGNAAVLRSAPASRPALLRSLREAQTRASGSLLALVFAAARGTLDSGELDDLRRLARQALTQLPPEASQRPWLDALAAAPASWELPVPLEEDQLLVVPRLSALARLQEFASEIGRAGEIQWVVRPGAGPGR